jgi:hypothetical protein
MEVDHFNVISIIVPPPSGSCHASVESLLPQPSPGGGPGDLERQIESSEHMSSTDFYMRTAIGHGPTGTSKSAER